MIAQLVAYVVGVLIIGAFYFAPVLAFSSLGILFFLTLAVGFIVEPLPRKDDE